MLAKSTCGWDGGKKVTASVGLCRGAWRSRVFPSCWSWATPGLPHLGMVGIWGQIFLGGSGGGGDGGCLEHCKVFVSIETGFYLLMTARRPCQLYLR
jgi:hypothetical protein